VLGVRGTAFKLTRIADGLRYVPPDQAVGRTCLLAAASLLDVKPTGLHLLLELAATAAATSDPAPIPPPIATLARQKSRTKLTEAARRLAALG